MSDRSEQRYDAVIGPPVTLNPLTWFRWERLFARLRRQPTRATEEQPYVTLATPPLPIIAPELTPAPVTVPASAYSVLAEAVEVVAHCWQPEPTLLLCVRGLPLSATPWAMDISAITAIRGILRIEWSAREDVLTDVLVDALLTRQMVHMRIAMHVPRVSAWEAVIRDENDALALARRLSGFVCQEMQMGKAPILVEANIAIADVVHPQWNVTVWLDDDQQKAMSA